MSPKSAGFSLFEAVVILAIVLFLAALIFQSLGSSCIVAGTLIDTPSGPRLIESLTVGDEVQTRAPNGKTEVAKITAKSEHTVGKYLNIVLEDNSSLGVTAEHPIATPKGWTPAGDLQPGDSVCGKDGILVVRSIPKVNRSSKVYDLTVEPNSNFFAAGILVHNKRIRNKERFERQTISVALEKYRLDLGSYPPDSISGKDGSEILTQFLCKKINVGNQVYGPYLENVPNAELISPFGGRYTYKIVDGKDALVIDPGPDKKLGGTVDPKKGFVSDGSGDDKDNLYSK